MKGDGCVSSTIPSGNGTDAVRVEDNTYVVLGNTTLCYIRPIFLVSLVRHKIFDTFKNSPLLQCQKPCGNRMDPSPKSKPNLIVDHDVYHGVHEDCLDEV